jgi:hypothetical protein
MQAFSGCGLSRTQVELMHRPRIANAVVVDLLSLVQDHEGKLTSDNRIVEELTTRFNLSSGPNLLSTIGEESGITYLDCSEATPLISVQVGIRNCCRP